MDFKHLKKTNLLGSEGRLGTPLFGYFKSDLT
jgi:hypothetical protein